MRALANLLCIFAEIINQAIVKPLMAQVTAVFCAGTEVYDPVSEGTGYQHYDDWLDTVHSNQSGEHSSVTFPPVPHTAAATPDLVTGMLSTTTLSGTGRENSSNEA